MSEPGTGRHGLEGFLDAAQRTSAGRVSASVLSALGHVNLRADPRDGGIGRALQAVLGQSLPVEPNTLKAGEQLVFWLGPDEFLVRTGAEQAQGLVESLSSQTRGQSATANDVSGGLCALRLEGADVRALLAKGCTLDLRADAFGAGRCAQTGLARASVLLACVDDPCAIDVVVRRSFADYLCRWIARAGEEFGVRFSTT